MQLSVFMHTVESVFPFEMMVFVTIIINNDA